jgi:hypothetical protein
MNLVACRYNPAHKTKVAKLLKHEEICPDRSGKNLQKCPYNPVHLLNPDRYNVHLEICPNRPIINKDIASEIRTYIEAQNKEKVQIKKDLENTSFKDTVVSNTTKQTKVTKPTSRSGVTVSSIVGLKNDSKQEKQLRKAGQREMRQLMHSSLHDSKIILEENQVDMNFEFDESDVNNNNGLNRMDHDDLSISELKEDDEYDPNESMVNIEKNEIPMDLNSNKQGTVHMVLRMKK